jgi:hypothetical protein
MMLLFTGQDATTVFKIEKMVPLDGLLLDIKRNQRVINAVLNHRNPEFLMYFILMAISQIVDLPISKQFVPIAKEYYTQKESLGDREILLRIFNQLNQVPVQPELVVFLKEPVV